MSQPAKAQEPSMEEILASIRRIIADDDTAKPAARSLPPRAAGRAAAASAPPCRRAIRCRRRRARPWPRRRRRAKWISATSTRCCREPDAPAGDAAPHADDVLELTEQMAAPARPRRRASRPSMASPTWSSPMRRPAGAAAARGRGAAAAAAAAPRHVDRGILSSLDTSAAVDSAFNSLAQTVLVQNARTLEDLVREMLRPMLKSWLDDNLPGMVERIVKAEIERVSRGRG